MKLDNDNYYADALIGPLWNWNPLSASTCEREQRFNRTFMELKQRTLVRWMLGDSRFNRTFMELKLATYKVNTIAQSGFNRTFMELKRR